LTIPCWNCKVPITKAENWTPANRVWIENPEGAAKPHDFRKCYWEKVAKESSQECQSNVERPKKDVWFWIPHDEYKGMWKWRPEDMPAVKWLRRDKIDRL
jgi:hypothetical protein